ncbi:hypothetical protein DFQ01_109111 [Paenibacillus cellulosilyticus]|uniref:Uncharacterized protein n=1 Tax=Paenibacillus cellulosilyticus TaxID=375489 RepID=A0A2V2YU81_9BACL|nr:hypothetical protein [Paenibacillus cellulosilyticus]PWW02486.1 hypothetical protein DFQ01_109111 [Paenibacillus cellulosilyticus]QKS47192.1 hypothetical protein HUB94_22375 [Paenibacillus cellulosilyticus]
MKELIRERKSRTVRTIAASILLAALMTTAACSDKSKSLDNGSGVESTTNGSDSTGVVETGTAPADSDSGSGDQSTQAGSGDSGNVDDTASASDNEVKEATGTYNGLADSHSAEIETDDGIFVYQLTEQAEQQASAIQSNAKVKIEYTESDGTRQLTKIEVVQ